MKVFVTQLSHISSLFSWQACTYNDAGEPGVHEDDGQHDESDHQDTEDGQSQV